MHARALEEASTRLRELRHEEREQLGVGALALAVAVVLAEVYQELAVPLFLGGLGVGVLGLRALLRRWDLLERLSCESDAYAIPDVLAHATRFASMGRRHGFAASLRHAARDPLHVWPDALADELEALAAELDDGRLVLDPVAAVTCWRLLTDLDESPLLDPELPVEELRWHVRRIRAGFEPRRSPTDADGRRVGPRPRTGS